MMLVVEQTKEIISNNEASFALKIEAFNKEIYNYQEELKAKEKSLLNVQVKKNLKVVNKMAIVSVQKEQIY